ncbi:hypothetical protein AU210_012239 [Fusarium oxysporum f. sp. radicis-cucumerinum]|uniref:RNA-directed DNA polymerase from transposon BS n=1 Tax=Fusarium oxysporum f. sp. radicis-cucumerinum TaxID=327505 RepID=A0A2H3GJN5_FUSOX|nr:hypothetical protein AU210_012239 [Fusarium oxysporum f. sp. radicis-cucumerinum]
MASFSTSPPAAPEPFDLGIHTPANLNRGARAALLQNSPATVNGTIGVLPVPRQMAQTPSSPLIAATAAAATEEAARANSPSTSEQQPISIIESANDLAREHAEEYNAKLMVFQTFCAKFEEAAQQFATGPQRRFARQLADSFLGIWKRELSGSGPTTPKPSYSSVAAISLPAAHPTIAPLRQDLRVFIRLEAGAPARAHSGYAIRTLIREKLGAASDKIRQVFQVRSGWAVLAADSATRDFLVEKQAEWAAELKPIAVETNKEWFTYVVSDVPTRLSDFYGNEVDSDSVVSDEIEIQTGLKPIDVRTGRQFSDNPLTKALLVSFLKPTKRFWSLFGSSAARLVDKTDRPRQCEKCWGHHFARNCHRKPVCRRCGETGHLVDDCIAPEQCVNCLGPHQANFRRCPARPKTVHGVLRRLTKEQRKHVRAVGAETYRQRHREPQSGSHQEAQQGMAERQNEDVTSQERPNARAPSPAVSGAPSCIMVATTPHAGYEAEEEPEQPRPGSPRKRRINDRKPLRIFQANVGKIPPAHDCALALADSEQYDVVLLQEPWTAHTETRTLTKTHPAYDTFTPVDMWNSNDTRPRVMTYVRRDPRLLADQIRPFQTRDILWLTINDLTIVNFYRQNDERDALDTLFQWSVPERCLVAGDFNARHRSWQTGQTTNRGQEIAGWVSENDLSLLNTLDIPTNPYGNTIDLAFTNLPLAEAIVEDHLATSSDHFTLSLTFPDVRSTPVQPGKIRVTTEDELKRFVEIVELGVIGIPLTDSTPEELDELASSLVSLLTSAAKASGRPARKGGRPAPWWTEECADAAAAFRAIRRSYLLGFNQDCGLPQGSPVSPILFLLYTEPIYRLGNPRGRFGYADDTAILSIGDTVDETTAMASSSIAKMVRWGAANGVSFDTKKTEVMHFSRSKLSTAPAVRHDDVEKHPESALRWLGIWLDSRLSFRVHVEKWAAKAKAVAYHLRGFTNTIHGPLPSAVRSAVRACVEPVLLHGSEAWYPGRSRPRWNQPTKDLPSKSVFRTRLRRTDELLASCTRPKLVQRYFHKEQIPPLQIASKEKSADAFIRWVESLDLLTLVVYSDGSLSSEEVASYGFTIYQNNVPIFDGSGRLGPAEVFDAEATGALEGLKAALNLRDAATQNIFICLDNLAAATCLRGTPSDSSQDVFLEFQALATSHGAVQVLWVPGHTDIPGNEQADKLARAASSLPEPEDAQPTLAYLRRIARQKPKEAFEAWWSTSAPEQYKRLNLKATTGCPPELSLPRAALHHLLAARSLHGDFATYHERFDHDYARLVCSCGRRKTPDHIFYCRKVPPRHRLRLAPSPNATVNLAIGKDFAKFIDLSKDSEFFGKICPRY